MKPKQLLLLAAFLTVSFYGKAQKLSNIDFKAYGNRTGIRAIEFISGNILIRVSPKGAVVARAINGTNYEGWVHFGDNPRRQPDFVANKAINYYDKFDGFENIGRVKSIGDAKFTWYDKYDGFYNLGCLKSIGNTKFTWYDKYDGFDNIGQLKSIGDIKITYYDHFDGDDVNGKIKSIGNTTIKYYDHFDGAMLNGKVKSISGKTPYLTINNEQDDAVLADNGD